MGGSPPTLDWLDECQRFDDALRSFDGNRLQAILGSAHGQNLVQQLDVVRARFEEAFSGVRDGLQDRMNGVRKRRVALNGYRSTGERLRGGPKFITTNL